uniref:Uncharacterized protein n=1 Tax=Rhizophora mucronata TaxID=61149 RepID=A0A2P2PZT2_RHIMU
MVIDVPSHWIWHFIAFLSLSYSWFWFWFFMMMHDSATL